MDAKRLAEAEGYYWRTLDTGDIVRDVFKIFIPTHFDPSIAPPGCQILIVQRPTPRREVEIQDYAVYKAEVHESTMSRLRALLPGIDDSHVACASRRVASYC